MFLLGSANFASANDIYSDKSPNLQNRTTYIPQGLKVYAVLSDELNSNNAIIGQNVELFLLENFKYGSTLIATAGSSIVGTVVKNKKSSKNPALMMVRFTSIRTPYNNIIPISAIIDTKDKTGILKGSSTAPDIIIPADTKIEIIFNQPITLLAQ